MTLKKPLKEAEKEHTREDKRNCVIESTTKRV
jgi:hypothetical protein